MTKKNSAARPAPPKAPGERVRIGSAPGLDRIIGRMLKEMSPPDDRPAAGFNLEMSPDLVRRLRAALAEDVGSGDLTTSAIVPPGMPGEGVLRVKAHGVFCGGPVAEKVWRLVSPKVKVEWLAAEGAKVAPGDLAARLSGPYGALLTGERVALNFLQRLSGIATATARLVEAAAKGAGRRPPPDILDTRKTTPLWRDLERYAVRAGGGMNHRFGLFDAVLIKENHVRAAGSIALAVERARAAGAGPGGSVHADIPLMVEARTPEEAGSACDAGAEVVLLDNMTPEEADRAIRRFRGRGVLFEVSGGVTPENAAAYAAAGADRLSSGALTHSAPALDLSLQLFPKGGSEDGGEAGA